MKAVYVTAALLALSASGARAVTIYDNYTASSGTAIGLDIKSGEVADSFTASAGTVIDGAQFLTEDVFGALPTQVTWTILYGAAGDSPFSDTVIKSGSAAVTATLLSGGIGEDGFSTDIISFAGVTLPSIPSGDVYWFELSGAADAQPFVYWDQSGGASTAFSLGGVVPSSNSFELFGSPAVAPEPAAWTLILTGFAGLGAMLRTGRRRATA